MVQNNSDSFLRIIKPEIDYSPGKEPDSETLHHHAAENLQAFIRSGKLQRDKNPSFYIYQISMDQHTQTGIIAAVSVQEYNEGLIKRHEFTRPEKENNRTRHFEITNANTGPVLLTFRNNGEFQDHIPDITNLGPDIAFQADDGTNHSLWKITSSTTRESLNRYFATIPALYIADGHHRAASASRVQKIRQDNNPQHQGNESYNYFLSVIFPHDEMQIQGYNRLVKDLAGLSDDRFLELIKTNFIIKDLPNLQIPHKKHTFSMYLNGNWYRLNAKNKIVSDDPVAGLDASILQNHLLNPILEIDNPRTNNRIDFVGGIRGLEELERRCCLDAKVAFALHPVSIDELLIVADADKVMPPKSTWFEPKLRSGLVVRLLD
jgi:uncharacterized protein (DUF1015 family)